jgi:hypothetical protein
MTQRKSMNKRWLIWLAVILVIVGVTVFVVALASLQNLDRAKAESIVCGNQMSSIGITARMWADENDGLLPADLRSLSNEVGSLRILICPSEKSRPMAVDWSSLSTNNTSYEIVTPRLSEMNTNFVFLRCKYHQHLGYSDGTVFDGTRRRTKIVYFK